LRDALEKFHPTPSQEGAEKIKSILADGLDEYAVSLKKVMDPVWQREFPDVRETVDDALHVGEHGRRLLQQEASAEPHREARAAATRSSTERFEISIITRPFETGGPRRGGGR
jgi:hypothetical protein